MKVVVLDRTDYARLVEAIRRRGSAAEHPRERRFVRRSTEAKEVVRELRPDPAVEQVKAVDGAILWATKRDGVNRSVMPELIGGAHYKELPVRNLNSTLRLHELLAG